MAISVQTEPNPTFQSEVQTDHISKEAVSAQAAVRVAVAAVQTSLLQETASVQTDDYTAQLRSELEQLSHEQLQSLRKKYDSKLLAVKYDVEAKAAKQFQI